MSEARQEKNILGIEEIKSFIPHRAPFLMLDRILDLQTQGDPTDLSEKGKVGTKVIAQKCVTYGEPHFVGHFPDRAIMPGVLIIEAMAQASSFSIYPYLRAAGAPLRAQECILLGVDEVRFRKPVVPGDVLVIESTVTRCRGYIWSFDCIANVEGKKVAEASILAHLMVQKEDA